MCRALVVSHIWCADVIRSSLSNSKVESLQLLHDRAVSMMHTLSIKGNWTLNFLAVKQLITFDCAVMVYRILNKLYRENIGNKFHLMSHYSRYNTRFCRIQIPQGYVTSKTIENSFDDLKTNQIQPFRRKALVLLYFFFS